MVTCAIEPCTSCFANSKSNSLSLPTVNFSTNSETDVLSFCQSFITRFFLRINLLIQLRSLIAEYKNLFLPLSRLQKYIHLLYDFWQNLQDQSLTQETASMLYQK